MAQASGRARTGIATAALALGFAGAPPALAAGGLTYIAHSTVKLQQLIGDFDKERQAPTTTRTMTRYGIEGTDLGYSFEHDGKLIFLFGDTVGKYGGDVVATSTTTDPESGLALDFLTDRSGKYLRVRPPGIKMAGFDVPDSGIDLDGRMYVVVKTNHSTRSPTDVSVLTRFDDRESFKVLHTISRLPAGKVIELAMHAAPETIAGLPPGGPWVLIWSSGVYRASDAYFSIVPRANFESGKGTKYFAGLAADGTPQWSDREANAAPVVDHPTIGDISVTWVAPLHLWLMTYDSRKPRGIILRTAATPWGPWSEPQVIFNIARDHGDRFIHRAKSDDGLAGPVIGEGKGDPQAVNGGAYAPYVIERFTRVDGDTLSLYYVMSTWNPYTVVLMRSRFHVN